MSLPVPPAVIDRFGLDPDSITPLPGGHINLSFSAVTTEGRDTVLQRVNAIFPPSINDDIAAVTEHLRARGVPTTRLLAARDGARTVAVADDVWRLLERVPGQTREQVRSNRQAAEAGRVLGEFHRALADFDEPLASRRPPVHDLDRHLAALETALDTHANHEAAARIESIAVALRALADRVERPPSTPARLVHGDPKISNVIFRDDRALALIDLDTITRIPVALEIGDALRSWCNTAAEDSPDAAFSLERADAALAGYAAGAGGLLRAAEWAAVPAATLAIAVELAARFAADALTESYFAWDRHRFSGASEHNEARARAQLALADSIAAGTDALEALAMTRA